MENITNTNYYHTEQTNTMTDYKALYEATLEENKKLKEELEKTKKYGVSVLSETLDQERKNNEALRRDLEKLEKENNVRKDIIYNLFSQRLWDDNVLDDGIDLTKQYGDRYIDEWNEIHEEIFDDVVKTMNMCEYDFEHFHLEYSGDTHFDLCMNGTDDEEEEDEQ